MGLADARDAGGVGAGGGDAVMLRTVTERTLAEVGEDAVRLHTMNPSRRLRGGLR